VSATALVELLAAANAGRGHPVPLKLTREEVHREPPDNRSGSPPALEVVGKVPDAALARLGMPGDGSDVAAAGKARQLRDGGDVKPDLRFSEEVPEQAMEGPEEDVADLEEELRECNELQDVMEIVRDECEGLGPASTVMTLERWAKP
jgi:hypothetical protein